jgi:hypothetical protein
MYIPAPSESNFSYWSLFEWLVFLLIIFFGIYAAWAIKNEKTTFHEDSVDYPWGHFLLPIAKWWSQVSYPENDQAIVFERSDTRYEWSCFFEIEATDLSAQEFLENWIIKEQIELDNSYDSFAETKDASYLIKDTAALEMIESFYRLEGTATLAKEKRIYLDVVTFKSFGKLYFAKSISSILNGCVEGPYFEETLKSIRINEELIT